MYREHEKSIDNIYENVDVTRGKFEREITDCNATGIQSSELTGTEIIKNTFHHILLLIYYTLFEVIEEYKRVFVDLQELTV